MTAVHVSLFAGVTQNQSMFEIVESCIYVGTISHGERELIGKSLCVLHSDKIWAGMCLILPVARAWFSR